MKHPRDYTVKDLQDELTKRGALMTQCLQNGNRQHSPGTYGHWHVSLINMTGPSRFAHGSGHTLEIAIVRAFQDWDTVPPPKAVRQGETGESLLARLGLTG